MRNESTLLEAQFNPTVTRYWLLSGVLVLACTIIGAPLAIIWLIVGQIFCKKYLDRMSCTLTDRSLIIKKGMLNRIEKTIPLEKITDLALFQGPIMRAMNLKGFKVETAGGGGAATGYLVALTGIVDTDGFRDAVLAQRDAREDRKTQTPATPTELPSPPQATNSDMAELIREIRNYAPKPSTPENLAARTAAQDETMQLLRDIRDSLKAIESRNL